MLSARPLILLAAALILPGAVGACTAYTKARDQRTREAIRHAQMHGDYATAIALAETELTRLEGQADPDPEALGYVAAQLGDCYQQLDRPSDARIALDKALAAYRDGGLTDSMDYPWVLLGRTRIALMEGDAVTARDSIAEAREAYDRLDPEFKDPTQNLGSLYYEIRIAGWWRDTAATEAALAALILALAQPDAAPLQGADAGIVGAEQLHGWGRIAEAQTMYERVVVLTEPDPALNQQRFQALVGLAWIATQLQDLPAAERYQAQAMPLATDAWSLTWIDAMCASMAMVAQDWPKAKTCVEAARSSAATLEDPGSTLPRMRLQLAHIALMEGRRSEAAKAVEGVLDELESLPYPPSETKAEAYMLLAAIRTLEGKRAEAESYLGSAKRNWDQIWIPDTRWAEFLRLYARDFRTLGVELPAAKAELWATVFDPPPP